MEQYNQASKVVALRTNDNMQNDVSCVFVKQYDSNSRFIRVEIWDEGGKIEIFGTPYLNVLRPDGAIIHITGRISNGGYAVIKLTPEAIEYPGQCPCDLTVVAPYLGAEENFDGDGATTIFVSESKLTDITSVDINGAPLENGWSYSENTHTLTFVTAPNEGDVIVLKGTGTQVLTSSTFYIIVEESNYSKERS